jgi:hypothetical protein
MGIILRYRNLLSTYKTRGYRLNHLKKWKSKFPIKNNPKIAGLVADLIADGHLQAEPKWRMDFTSKSKRELLRFGEEIRKLFGIKGKLRRCEYNQYSKSYNFGLNSAPLARIFFLLGVPSGDKVLKKFDIPKWIKDDKECFRNFCKRIFTCEGTIMHERSRKIPQIRLEFWKSKKLFSEGLNFVWGMCKLMDHYFRISSTITFPKNRNIRKDKKITRPIKIYILNKNVIRFYNEIGFEGDKQKSLKALINM